MSFAALFLALIADNFGILALFQVLIADSFGISALLQMLIAENVGILTLSQALIKESFGIFNTLGKIKHLPGLDTHDIVHLFSPLHQLRHQFPENR